MSVTKTKNGILPLLIVSVLVLFYMFIAIKNKKALDKNHRFTIGKVYDHMYLTKSNEKIYYNFKYMNKNYSSSLTGNKLNKTVGENYIVKFNAENPNNSEILLGFQLEENIIHLAEGWGEIPQNMIK